jgi:hypothetical protein
MFWQGHILSTVGNALRAGPLVRIIWSVHCTMDEANSSKTIKISVEFGPVYVHSNI